MQAKLKTRRDYVTCNMINPWRACHSERSKFAHITQRANSLLSLDSMPVPTLTQKCLIVL